MVLLGINGPSCDGSGWAEMTRLSCWLILLLIPLIAKLAARVQQLEDAISQKPTPDAPTPMMTIDVEPELTTDPTPAELMARIQQLEETQTRQRARGDR